jgi:phage replication-related protein YjqB (UPF0714/DUF867 family)
MATHSVSVELQQNLTSAEHCGVDLNVLQAVGSDENQQVRIKNPQPQKWDALYTVKKRPVGTNDIVGIREDQNLDPEQGIHGLLRLGMPIGTQTGFNGGTLDSQVVGSDFTEDAQDDGTNTWSIIVIAPHGGMIEPNTAEQAEEVRLHLNGKGVSHWLCRGFKAQYPGAPSDPQPGQGGAYERWHITSTDISAESFPKLKGMLSRGFKCAIAFHGFKYEEIRIGGTAGLTTKQKVQAAIANAIDDGNGNPLVPVCIAGENPPCASPSGEYNGGDSQNVLNRLTIGGANTIQLEQDLDIRKTHGLAIARAVADVVYAECVGTPADTQAPVTTCTTSPVPNAAGWNKFNVTVTLQATDPGQNPSGVDHITYSVGGAPKQTAPGDTVTFPVTTEGQTTITFAATDKASPNPNTETPEKSCAVRLDKTPPTITVVTPTDGANFTLNQQVFASYSCNDAGSGLKSFTGTVPDGSPLDISSYGPKTFTVTAEDNAGNKTVQTVTYNVFFNFTGFFPPIHENWPKLNKQKAGSNVPVKFSLGGNQGLDIFAQGYPKSQEIPCNNPNVEVAGTDPTTSPGGSGLTYDAGSDQYHYNWKTEKGWEGSCRQLVVKLKDGSFHRANFQFT